MYREEVGDRLEEAEQTTFGQPELGVTLRVLGCT